MKKNKKIIKADDTNKKLVVALTGKIEEHKKKQIGGNFEKEGMFYKTKVTFNAKSMNKYQYSQLFALYDFMKENPNLSEADVRRLLRSKPIKFAFLNKCDTEVEDFLGDLKDHGPVYVATYIESHNGGLEKWAKRHL